MSTARASDRAPEGTSSTSALASDELPRKLGRTMLLRRVAKGGMGEVYLGSTLGIEGAERPVIVKVIRREHSKDPSFLARFLDEARVQAQLQHSGVAQVLEATTDDATGEPYAVVEHVEGKSLGELRARALSVGYSLSWIEAVSIAQLMAEGLAHVHERKDASGRSLAIVHRDLSPQNVMVSFAGEAKIIDFGTARGQNRRCHTVAGVVFAKPGYVAPEVANGDPGDARVDLYALGVMLWELCAGRRFLEGDAQEHLGAVAKNQRDLPPIAAAVGAPPALDGLLAKLTAFDRDARYGSARVASTDLARLLAEAPSLPSHERGVRARVAHLMTSLFPGEPQKSRREFAELVAQARRRMRTEPKPEPRPSEPERRAAPPALPSDPDMLLGTRYKLGRELGRGSTSVVYEAEHLDLGRKVALKVLSPEGGEGGVAEFVERFRAEARVLSSLSSPALVTVHDFGETGDGRPYCAMELLSGETLERHLDREKGMDFREALVVARRVLVGLEVAHGAGLVHRDLKPANVFLVDEGVKILDFGLAELARLEGGVVGEGLRMVGTPEYMAPEQASPEAAIDARADLYALGCMLYEMLTGRLPFVGEGPVALLEAKRNGSPERLRDRAPARAIPEAVDELVMRALARHPSVRFQSAVEMRKAIDEALAAPAKKRGTRRGVGLALVGATMALALGLLVHARPPALARLFGPPAEPATAELAPSSQREAPTVLASDDPELAREPDLADGERVGVATAAKPAAPKKQPKVDERREVLAVEPPEEVAPTKLEARIEGPGGSAELAVELPHLPGVELGAPGEQGKAPAPPSSPKTEEIGDKSEKTEKTERSAPKKPAVAVEPKEGPTKTASETKPSKAKGSKREKRSAEAKKSPKKARGKQP
jgi:serine/threonine protein kinase